MIKVAVIGFGSRGRMFGNLIQNDETVELVAIADTAESCRKYGIQCGIPENMCFDSADSFFAQGKICDAVFICTQDAQHIDMALKAMELGYDICLEKPAAVNIEDCITIRDTANKLAWEYGMTSVYHAMSILGRPKRGPHMPLELNAFSIGELGFATFATETPSTTSLAVRYNSPYKHTVMLCRNFPDPEALLDSAWDNLESCFAEAGIRTDGGWQISACFGDAGKWDSFILDIDRLY